MDARHGRKPWWAFALPPPPDAEADMLLRIACLIPLVATPALGEECTARLDQMEPKVADMQDATLKRLAEYDVKRGHRELAEGDEAECDEAADHLQSLLNGR